MPVSANDGAKFTWLHAIYVIHFIVLLFKSPFSPCCNVVWISTSQSNTCIPCSWALFGAQATLATQGRQERVRGVLQKNLRKDTRFLWLLPVHKGRPICVLSYKAIFDWIELYCGVILHTHFLANTRNNSSRQSVHLVGLRQSGQRDLYASLG